MKNSFWINNRRLKLLAADVLTVRERAFLGLAVVLLLMLSWSGFTAFMHRPFSFLNIFFIHHYFPYPNIFTTNVNASPWDILFSGLKVLSG